MNWIINIIIKIKIVDIKMILFWFWVKFVKYVKFFKLLVLIIFVIVVELIKVIVVIVMLDISVGIVLGKRILWIIV